MGDQLNTAPYIMIIPPLYQLHSLFVQINFYNTGWPVEWFPSVSAVYVEPTRSISTLIYAELVIMPYPEHRSTSLLHYVPVQDSWSSSSSGWPIVILPSQSNQKIKTALQSVKPQRERRGQRRNTGRRRRWWTLYQVQFGRPWKVGRIHPRLHWRILSL